MKSKARTLSGINILAGIWLIIAPFVLNYDAMGNAWLEVVFGVIVAALGIMRLFAPRVAWPSWANMLVGLLLIVAPWVIYSTTVAVRWSEVVVGIIVAALAWESAAATSNYHSHHHV